MTEIKEEDIEIHHNGDWLVSIHVNSLITAKQLKQQILENQEIVYRLRFHIKILNDLKDKDTIYKSHKFRTDVMLPYLENILDEEKK
jgi:hypothetical protein